MRKFPALEIYCFKPLIVFALTSQETIKNNNIEQYLYCSQIQVAFRDTFSLGFKKKRRQVGFFSTGSANFPPGIFPQLGNSLKKPHHLSKDLMADSHYPNNDDKKVVGYH